MAMRRGARNILLAVAGIVLVAGAGRLIEPLGRPFAIVLAAAAAPLHGAAVSFRRTIDALSGSKSDVVSLQARIEQLTTENAALKTLEADNAALKTALGYKERSGVSGHLARVLSETGEEGERAIIIDKGSEDGIKEGQPVVVGDGAVIAKVARVGDHAATCLLLNDARSRLAVAVQNRDETIGVLQGDRGISMEVTYIPQGASIAPGDTVITSGIEPAVRRGLVVGTIRDIRKNSQDPFQTATVDPLPSSRYPIFVTVLDEAVNAVPEQVP
jgi:rod shape-determining protein MreC